MFNLCISSAHCFTQICVGRGPIQLQWNYNYKDFGDFMNLDLLNNPDLITQDQDLAWHAVFWFWMTDHGHGIIHEKLQVPDGNFMWVTFITNGGLECGTAPLHPYAEITRQNKYKIFCDILKVEVGVNLSCQLNAFNSVPTTVATTPQPPRYIDSSGSKSVGALNVAPPPLSILSDKNKCTCNRGACKNGICKNCSFVMGNIRACYYGWSAEICKAQGPAFSWCGD